MSHATIHPFAVDFQKGNTRRAVVGCLLGPGSGPSGAGPDRQKHQVRKRKTNRTGKLYLFVVQKRVSREENERGERGGGGVGGAGGDR